MQYELWDTETANLAGEYPTEVAALAAVYRMVKVEGPDALTGYTLLHDDGERDPLLIAADRDLAALARRRHELVPAG